MSFYLVVALSQVFGQVTNNSELNDIALTKAAEFKAQKAEAVHYANQHNLPLLIDKENVYMELMYIDALGQPQYYVTHNVNSAASISTNEVNTGGSTGYNLDGAGMTIHEWDGGGVLTTHQEYGGRVVQGDGVTSTHYHSTHVAGTLIASGVSANAKGMAPAASLRAFDWNSDEAEMASEAANNNALVSNHSYGFGRGWEYDGASWVWYGSTSVSTLEDYLFGFYDSQAQSWDNIAYNAPYYLIVKSAGNDRDDGPGSGTYPDDGPYDCISHAGVAKNILTVGAVGDIAGGYTQPSDVIMSSFSSWGPADDGRIKPDIVANGTGLYSTDNGHDADYTSLSGTSMSSPSAAGSLILLQEYYEDLNGPGNYMLSSTLKALVIHTADEAGTADGPDYEYGWGLMNTEKAADVISDDIGMNTIEENLLVNGGSYQRTVTALGGVPLKVSIVWTDVPGSPVVASLDPTDLMLVNDLDLRLTESANTYYPWKLDGTNPANAATRNGENNVDNVELVCVDNPTAGVQYTIIVDHDGALNGGSQAFSLIVTGVEPPAPIPPVTDFAANTTNSLTGSMITFSDLSTNAPNSWNWTFSPSTVTYVNGTDANSRNPQLTFDAPGTYDVTLVATNAYGSDTELKSAYITITDPLPLTLPWVEGFEEYSGLTAYTANASYIDGLPEWNYEKTEVGRARFNAGPDFCYTGNFAATLDASPAGPVSVNYLIATLNLSDYASSTDLELSFTYMQHGEEEQTNDRVWIRGSNTDLWLEAYDLYANQAAPGIWKSVLQIDIDDILSSNGQTPGATFQLRFGQEDDYPALSPTGSDGITFDDITVQEIAGSAYVINSFPYTQSWESGLGLWMQSAADNFDWTLNTGSTPSSTTGPSGAHDATTYLFTESSSPRVDGDETYLEATFNFTSLQDPELSFYYHMYGSTMGSLHVDIYDGTVWNTDVWVASGQLQTGETDPYAQAVVDLSAWGGQDNIMIRFRGIVGNGGANIYYSDMAFDLIQVNGAGIPQPPVADFTADNTSITEGGSVQFTDLSSDATAWSWTFAGGTPENSTTQHPNITYNTAGVYTVELTVSNADGTDTETKTDYITVIEVLYPPVADFTSNTNTIEEGETIQFNDQSSNNPDSWSWSFEGANTPNSTDQNPAVSYSTAGTYSVTLVAANADGTDTEVKTGYVTVNPVLSQVELTFTDFEGGWGIWTDGGADCQLHTSGTYSWGGSNAADIQDNSGIASSFYLTNGIDVHTPGYVQIDVEFYFVAIGQKNSKDVFWVEYYDGSSWNTVATFACKTDFIVGNYYMAVISIPESAYNFPTDMKIRFMNGAKKDTKDVYIDNIKIIGSTEVMPTNNGLTLMTKAAPLASAGTDGNEETIIDLYPNPATNNINIVSSTDAEMTIFVYNISGQQMYYGERLDNHQVIDVSNLERGLYVVKVISDDEVITTRFLKQ